MFMSWLLGFCIIASALALLIHLSNFNACIYQCVLILHNYFMQFLGIFQINFIIVGLCCIL